MDLLGVQSKQPDGHIKITLLFFLENITSFFLTAIVSSPQQQQQQNIELSIKRYSTGGLFIFREQYESRHI